jgi:tetratricopeptide (TPR) repeat protein
MNSQHPIQLAKATAAEGDTKTAIAILRRLLKENPQNVDAWLALADIVEKPEQAEQCWERVLQIDPDNQIAQQKLFRETSDGFALLFETTDEPIQESEINLSEAEILDFSNLYTQEDQTEMEPAQSEEQDALTSLASASIEKGSNQQLEPRQKLTARKPDKKKKRLSGIEITLIVVIVFLCLCLCIIGFASFAKNSILQSLDYSEILGQEPTNLPSDVTAVIYENIRLPMPKILIVIWQLSTPTAQVTLSQKRPSRMHFRMSSLYLIRYPMFI